MTYKSTRRQWVKLWVNEWLDGTTRFELTAPQRLLWVDLLALAGRSRFPGFVYAGTTQGGEKVGYPLAYLAGVLQMDEISLNNALLLLKDHGHISIEEVPLGQFIIGIVNWEKYQSEYFRQKSYREVTTEVTPEVTTEVTPTVTTQTTKRLLVEGEVEEEVEVEGEEEKRKTPQPLAFAGKVLRITEKQHQRLTEVFGRHGSEYQEADLWLEANPRKVRKNHFAFMRNWLSRGREKAQVVASDAQVGSGPLERAPRICAVCGATGSWHLNAKKNKWAVDHEFSESVSA